jgi:hypothetical protein
VPKSININLKKSKLIKSMGGAYWVRGQKWSSFLEEIVELSVFSSSVVILLN